MPQLTRIMVCDPVERFSLYHIKLFIRDNVTKFSDSSLSNPVYMGLYAAASAPGPGP